MEVQSETLLTKYAEHEKVAYLGALAGLATADREASDEEIEHLREIAHAAGLSAEDEQNILQAAKDISGNDLKKHLDVLKGSLPEVFSYYRPYCAGQSGWELYRR